MSTFCTTADLEQHAPTGLLGQLFDDVTKPPVWGDAAKSCAESYLAEAELKVRARLRGRVSLDDSSVLASLKRPTSTIARWLRWEDRGKTGRVNPLYTAYLAELAFIDGIKSGEQKVGDGEQPEREAYAAGGGQAGVFTPDGDGKPSRFMEDW